MDTSVGSLSLPCIIGWGGACSLGDYAFGPFAKPRQIIQVPVCHAWHSTPPSACLDAHCIGCASKAKRTHLLLPCCPAATSKLYVHTRHKHSPHAQPSHSRCLLRRVSTKTVAAHLGPLSEAAPPIHDLRRSGSAEDITQPRACRGLVPRSCQLPAPTRSFTREGSCGGGGVVGRVAQPPLGSKHVWRRQRGGLAARQVHQ